MSPAQVPKMTVRTAAVPTSSCRMSRTALNPRPMYSMPRTVTAMRTVTPGLGPASSPSSAVNNTPAQMAPKTATGL